jgi:putative YhdH/YhfP family quinone oxidoreductase
MTDAQTFKAMVVEEADKKTYTREIKERSISDLPDGDVLVRVHYSSLNYKDALSAVGNKGVTRSFPHTPGIDAAGVVEESQDSAFKPGDEVIVTSYDLGMNTDGGFGQYIRVPAGWVVPLPAGLSLRESMIYGTAGFTAGMSVAAVTHTVPPEKGDILVSGATGGVGSLAVGILSKIGYSVTAVSGKSEAEGFLKNLGAKAIIGREEASDDGGKPMIKGRWAGAVDTVGGEILATTLKSTDMDGTVACCGLVASPDLPINVFPFILRGVTLVGIDSQNCPMDRRKKIWERLAGEWKIDQLEEITRETDLDNLTGEIDTILRGGQMGRVVVNLKD